MAAFTGLGAGTELDPFQITTVAQFKEMDGYGIMQPIQTGTGLNDCVTSGLFYGLDTDTYKVTIVTATSGILTLSIRSGGSGYLTGDTITVNGGLAGNLAVLNVGYAYNGVVQNVSISSRGQGYSVGTGLTTTTNGVGVGCTIDVITLEPDTFNYQKNALAPVAAVAITGRAQTLTDGVVITFASKFGHTVGDIFTIPIIPKAYWKLMNSISFLTQELIERSIKVSNFYGSFDGNNLELTDLVLGGNSRYGFTLKKGSSVKSIKFRVVDSVNAFAYHKESTLFGADTGTLSNVTLSDIHIVTSETGALQFVSMNSFDATCTLKNITVEGTILGGFKGSVAGTIEGLRMLRTNNPDRSFYSGLPLVSSLLGKMVKCQNILLKMDIVCNGWENISFLAGTIGDTSEISESFVAGDIKITFTTPAAGAVQGLLYSGTTNAAQKVTDCYFKGKLEVNGGVSTLPNSGGASGYLQSPNIYVTTTRYIANVNLITPQNTNRPVFTKATSTRITDCFYNKDVITGMTPVDAVGQTGLTASEFSSETSYPTFDFATIWVMGVEMPELRNNPLYAYETSIVSVNVLNANRSSETEVAISLGVEGTTDYGVDVYQEGVLVGSQSNSPNCIVTIPRLDTLFLLTPFYMDGITKIPLSSVNYQHYIMESALTPSVVITMDAIQPAGIVDVSPLAVGVHGSLIYNGYIYGVTRNNYGMDGGVKGPNKYPGCIVRAPEHNIAAMELIAIRPADKPDIEVARGMFSQFMEQIVECNGLLYFFYFCADFPSTQFLCQYDPILNDYKSFIMPNTLMGDVIISDGEYLYLSIYQSQKTYKFSASQFIGDFPKYPTVEFPVAIAGIYDETTQGGHIAGGYDSVLKGRLHSACCDSEYLYLSYTTSTGTSFGYYEPLDISCHEAHKVLKSDMTAAGYSLIPKSTDDMSQNATHMFYGIELRPEADPRTLGYGWGAYAVRKSDMRLTGLPRLHSLDLSPAVNSYGSLVFGNYLFDIKTNGITYIIDISDVDNWDVSEPIGQRTISSFKYPEIGAIPLNEILLAEDSTFYAFTWGYPATLAEFQIPSIYPYAIPTIETVMAREVDANIVLSGYILATGGKTILSRGFRYGTNALALTESVVSLDETTTFEAALVDLPLGTYYYQAYAINSEGESVADIKSFSNLKYHWRIKMVSPGGTSYGADNTITSFKNL